MGSKQRERSNTNEGLGPRVYRLLKVKVTLRLTVCQSVCLGVEAKYGTFDHRFFFSKLPSCHFWGALSDERSGLYTVY
jgi:hypothetical protein